MKLMDGCTMDQTLISSDGFLMHCAYDLEKMGNNAELTCYCCTRVDNHSQ